MSNSNPSTPKRERSPINERVRIIKNEFFDPDTNELNAMAAYMTGNTCVFNPADMTISFEDETHTTVFRLQLAERALSRRVKAKE